MAAKVAIAIRREEATNRITAVCGELAARNGIEAGDLSPRHKQPDIERAMQLEAIAAFLEALAKATPPTPKPESKPAPATTPTRRRKKTS